jgi:hypothetical protein
LFLIFEISKEWKLVKRGRQCALKKHEERFMSMQSF